MSESKTSSVSPESKVREAVSAVLLTDTKKANEILEGIVHATASNSTSEQDIPKLQDAVEKLDLSVSDKMFCSYCNWTFIDRDEQISHYKTDWHRFNLKQKLRNARHVSVEEFEEMTGDISSISGSDSDSSYNEETISKRVDSDIEDESSGHIEGIGKRHPRVFFRNSDGQLLSIYRCVIHGKRNQPASLEDLVSLSTELPNQMTWTVLMTAGGHFAGAVFQRGEMVAHKTFHRYVVRAKRGTAQSARDAQGNAPKSAGASLRRYNEAALTQEVQDLLVSWSEYLRTAGRIFVRVPSYNKNIYYSGKNSPIQKDDTRIRMIPFSTRRPTLKEVRRVYDLLATIECYGYDTDLSDHVKKSPTKELQRPSVKPSTGQQSASRKKKKARQAELSVESSSDEEQEESDPVFSFQQEITDTADLLKPFEATKNPRRRKRKDKTGSKENPDENEDRRDDEFRRIRNLLFTACKKGDLDSFNNILASLETPRNAKSGTKAAVHANANCDTKEPCEDVGNVNVCDNIRTDGVGHSGDGDSVVQMAKDERKIDKSHILNKPFGDQERTLLHVATEQSHKPVIYRLLEAGADPAIKDMCDQVPYNYAKTKDVRNEFRTFMRSYPDKYDYIQAQIPAPLSEEREAEKKAKEAEKRKAQRKIRKEKQKVQRDEEKKKQAEEREKQRYLALSDREKRALAAEKRLKSQIEASGGAVSVLSRCFQCAVDMTGKVPFEYCDFKFCTTKCLKEHKAKASVSTAKS